MSTPKKTQDAKLAIDPLKENEAGQIEGGFSEILSARAADDGLNVHCPVTNQSQCGGGGTTTTFDPSVG
jgi:hypothetical protein